MPTSIKTPFALILAVLLGPPCVVARASDQEKPALPQQQSASSFRAAHTEDFVNGPRFGMCLDYLPDIDGDALPDLAIGDPFRTATSGRVVIAAGNTGTVLGWVDGPRGIPSFGREVCTLGPTADGTYKLLVSQPWSAQPKIVSFDCREFRPTTFCQAEDGEFGFGAWFASWRRTVEGKRIVDGIVVFSTKNGDEPETELVSREVASYRLWRYDANGSLRARFESKGHLYFDSHPFTITTVPGPDMDDIAVADSEGLHLLAGIDLQPRWTSTLGGLSWYFMGSVSSPGDLNGDGRADLVVGCPGIPEGQADQIGKVFLVSGRDGSTLRTLAMNDHLNDFGFACAPGVSRQPTSVSFLLSRRTTFADVIWEFNGLDPDPMIEWKHGDWDCPEMGWRILPPRDLDGDRVPDIVTTRFSESCRGARRQGVVVFSGKTQESLYSLEREPTLLK